MAQMCVFNNTLDLFLLCVSSDFNSFVTCTFFSRLHKLHVTFLFFQCRLEYKAVFVSANSGFLFLLPP